MTDPRLEAAAQMAANPAFIQRHLTKFRAPLKEKTMFGPAGKAILHSSGEKQILGPNGDVIARVTEDEMHGTQIEEDDCLHAVVRPGTVTKGARAHT